MKEFRYVVLLSDLNVFRPTNSANTNTYPMQENIQLTFPSSSELLFISTSFNSSLIPITSEIVFNLRNTFEMDSSNNMFLW